MTIITIIYHHHHHHHLTGFTGFYQGVLSPLCALTLLNTINFSLYERINKTLHQTIPSSSSGTDD
jgi:hypothetical protein